MSTLYLLITSGVVFYFINKNIIEIQLIEFNKQNKFFRTLKMIVQSVGFLLSILISIFVFNIFGIEIKIEILNISAIGILVAVLLTVIHNFYLKEEDKLEKEKFEKYSFLSTVKKMINKISNEKVRLEEEADGYNKDKNEKLIQNLDFLTIKNSLQKDIEFLYLSGYKLSNNKLLNEIDTKYLSILNLNLYSNHDLSKKCNLNIRILEDISNKLKDIEKEISK
ncbi:hypothetical protein KJ877_05525 [bacterium]|nr:hypothetical protein [bacterium]MBU1990492.1 hypothetical protein [bacterium]